MKWFRFYHDALDDPKVQRLPGDLFKFWVNLLCLGSRSQERGLVQMSVSDIAFDVRLDETEAADMMAKLIERGLIEEVVEGFQIHNWDARQFKSDNVSERVKKTRAKQKAEDETLQVTPGETLEPSVYTDTQINRVTDVQKVEGANAPQPPSPKPQEPPKPKKRASRIPEDFAITDRDREWARERGASPLSIERETEKFVNYWTAESGAKASKLDWHAAWKVWMGRNLPDTPRTNVTRIEAPARYPSERVGRDGLTDSERGWRENPGHKGWSADELMRMANAMEQQERERNTA